jgi:SAM-dependent methyltransferase
VDAGPGWYRTFFAGDWLEALALRIPPEQTSSEVDFVLSTLELQRGARLLDVPCGSGRHAVELARRGFRVTGADLSRDYVERAREAARIAGVEVELLQADMRELPFAGGFDAVLNLWTSFGYLESVEEDRRALEAMARALEPGGRWLGDLLNLLWLVRSGEEHRRRELDDGTVVLEDGCYDVRSGRHEVVWTIERPGRRVELASSLRLYTLPELESMLDRAGLGVDGVWGGFDGCEYGLDTRRMIVRARKRGPTRT